MPSGFLSIKITNIISEKKDGFKLIIKIVIWAAVFLVCPLLLTVSCLMISPKKEYKKSNKYYQFLLDKTTWLILKLCRVSLNVEGTEDLPADGHFVLVTNHRSKFDSLILRQVMVDRNCINVHEEADEQMPFLGRLFHRCGSLLHNPHAPKGTIQLTNRAVKHMRKTNSVVVFYPEGIINTAKTLKPFRNGMFKIAQRAKASLAVVSIHGSDHIHLNFPQKPTVVTVRLQTVIPVEELLSSTTAQIGDHVSTVLSDGLSEL